MADGNKDFGKDFADDARKAANEFQEEVKKTFDPNSSDNGKIVAIIAHLTIIGWVVALIMNSQNRTEFGSFYIRQTLGIWLLTFVLSIIPIVGCFAAVIGVVLIIMSLINAASNKMDLTVVLGEYFQDWFKSL
ncbi:YtxH domain-containing protein [Zobellia nedashkovskayae]